MEQLALILIPFTLGLVWGRRRPRRDSLGVDVCWSTACGLVFAGAATWLLYPLHFDASELFTSSSNFIDYCVGIVHFEEHGSGPSKRTRLAALLPYLLAQWVGILDGIAWGAIISSGIIGAGLYVWGRAIGGRVAGVVTVAAALTMAPLISIPRNMTYYPEIIAALVVGTAACAVAIRRRTPGAMVLAGFGVGLCLLIDARGLIWAIPLWLGTLAVAVLAPGRRALRFARVAALTLPLWPSWFGGWLSYGPESRSLEQQIDVRPLYYDFEPDNPLLAKPWDYPSHWVWGRTALTDFPTMVEFVVHQASIPTPAGFVDWQGGARDVYFAGWMSVGAGSLVLCVLCFLRRPLVWWMLFVTSFPYVVALQGTASMVEMQIRFLANGMPAVAVWMGVAFAGVARIRGPWRGPPSWARAVALVGGVVLVVTGAVPTWLAPGAVWRHTWNLEQSDMPKVITYAMGGTSETPAGWYATCAEAVAADNRGSSVRFDAYRTPGWVTTLRGLGWPQGR